MVNEELREQVPEQTQPPRPEDEAEFPASAPREGASEEPQEGTQQENAQEESIEALRLRLRELERVKKKANEEAKRYRLRLRETEKRLQEAEARIKELEARLAENQGVDVKKVIEERDAALKRAEELEHMLREERLGRLIFAHVVETFKYPDIAADLVKKYGGDALWDEDGQPNEEAIKDAVALVRQKYPDLVKAKRPVSTDGARGRKEEKSMEEYIEELKRRYPALGF